MFPNVSYLSRKVTFPSSEETGFCFICDIFGVLDFFKGGAFNIEKKKVYFCPKISERLSLTSLLPGGLVRLVGGPDGDVLADVVLEVDLVAAVDLAADGVRRQQEGHGRDQEREGEGPRLCHRCQQLMQQSLKGDLLD